MAYPGLPLQKAPKYQSSIDFAYLQPTLVARVYGIVVTSTIQNVPQDPNGAAGVSPGGRFGNHPPGTGITRPLWFGQINGPRRMALMVDPGGASFGG